MVYGSNVTVHLVLRVGPPDVALQTRQGSKVPKYRALRVSISGIVAKILGRHLRIGHLDRDLCPAAPKA